MLLLRTSPEVSLDKSALQGAINVASLLLVIHAAANFFVYGPEVKIQRSRSRDRQRIALYIFLRSVPAYIARTEAVIRFGVNSSKLRSPLR